MASRLNPYLNFPGTAREAMEFYRDALGGELRVNTFGEYGMEGAGADGVMHAMLESDAGFALMASDLPPGGPQHNPGDNIAISLSGDDEAELRGYWDKLSDGGTVTMPLEKQMWGDVFGMCVDRFGIPWMVNIAQPT
jgi:PhnB protein